MGVVSLIATVIVIMFWDGVTFSSSIDYAKKYCILNYKKSYTKKDLENLVYEISEDIGIDPYLVFAIIKVESNWDICAVSYKGAIGLMQVLPSTARFIYKEISMIDLFNPRVNIFIGVSYLRYLIDMYLYRYRYDYWKALTYAIFAYYAGPNRKRFPKEAYVYFEKVMQEYIY